MRSLSLEEGNVSTSNFVVGSSEQILSIVEKHIKSLGETFDSSIIDKGGSAVVEEMIIKGLATLDKSLLLGTSTVWVLLFLLL